MQADDADLLNNGTVEYVINESDRDEPFSLDLMTGLLTATDEFSQAFLAGQFGIEDVWQFRFDIKARDKGKPPRSTGTNVIVSFCSI